MKGKIGGVMEVFEGGKGSKMDSSIMTWGEIRIGDKAKRSF